MPMIETIRIEHLLRETVTTPYSVLVTRATGAAVRARIQQVLAGSPFQAALLDFSAVEVLDFSCADEIVAKLLLSEATGRFLVLRVGCHDQRDAIDHVLMRQGLAVAVLIPGEPSPVLLGDADDDLRSAFALISTEGPLDVADVAIRRGWPLARAAEVLSALVRHRLVRPSGPVHHPLPLPSP